MSVSAILALVALVLALLALLGIGREGVALSLAVVCLALAHLLPGVGGLGRPGKRL